MSVRGGCSIGGGGNAALKNATSTRLGGLGHGSPTTPAMGVVVATVTTANATTSSAAVTTTTSTHSSLNATFKQKCTT